MPLPITSAFAAIFAIALVALSVPISFRRIAVGHFVGDSTDEELRRRIRAQGNFTEYVPIGLIALGLVEAHGSPSWMVLAIAGSLAVGRVLHAIGMFRSAPSLRGLGALLTYFALLGSALYLLSTGVRDYVRVT